MALFLGVDAGTQSLKIQIVDTDTGQRTAAASVAFGRDLPDYHAPHGFIDDPDPAVRHADPRMWLDALDLALARLRDDGVPLDAVRGVSGSGQQHGSVYLNADFEPLLARLDPARTLAEQLAPALARATAPIWMDRSTRRECDELTARFGERLARDTGSPAIERFTGPQIRKFARENPDAYRATRTIHLVGSFLASTMAGHSTPIDYGDGAGMNLLNLRTLDWDPDLVEFTAPGLAAKLPPAAPCDKAVGGLAPYFAKYGLRPGTPVFPFSGDNPNSLVGTGATAPGVAVASFGTSDTFFGAMRAFATDPDGYGHVFGNPAGGFMSLICFTNGSLARERVRDDAGVDWPFFDRDAEALSSPGNDGRLMLPYFVPESTPRVLSPSPRYNFDPAASTPAERVRACLESQALAMRLHAGWMGEDTDTLRVTGGASGSPFFRRVLADVFQATVETVAVADSAALGAALRAAEGVEKRPWAALYAMFCAPCERLRPDPSRAALYAERLDAYRRFEAEAQER